MESFVAEARHVEVQLVGDGDGAIVHFGERDCSVQRRYQKVIEEAPCVAMPAALRAQLHEAAVRLAKGVSYRNAGTVEFLYDVGRQAFYFIEVNARIQVEHPVTEMVTGRDLVQEQLRIAGGQGLSLKQADVVLSGACHRMPHQRRGPGARLPASARGRSRAGARPRARASGSIRISARAP